MLLSLPFDVLVLIFQELSVEDILTLRCTCRDLHWMTEDLSAWINALQSDILPRFPLPHVFRSIQSLSAQQLRRSVVTAYNADKVWRQDIVVPLRIRSLSCLPNIVRFHLLPGGNSVAMVARDGRVILQGVASPECAVVLPPCPSDMSCFLGASVSCFSPTYDALILVEMNLFAEGQRLTNIYVYQAEAAKPSLALIDIISVKHPMTAWAAGGDTWIYTSIMDSGQHLVHVRRAGTPWSEESMLMDISDTVHQSDYKISVISRTRFLLCTRNTIYVFDIPDPEAFNASTIYPLAPIWTYRTDDSFYNPIKTTPVIWEGPDQTHTRPLVLIGFSEIHVVHASGQPSYYVLNSGPTEYRTHTQVGHQRVVWIPGSSRAWEGRISLKFTNFFEAGGQVKTGSMTVPVHIAEIPLGLEFDEASGRICMLVRSVAASTFDRKRLVVVDVI